MSEFTEVELTWLKKRIENYIRFGKTVSNRKIDRSRGIVSFTPNGIFAFVRWTANDFGTIASRLDILRAVAAGQRCATIPFVRPGADILLSVSGWPKVERVLKVIDAIEALGIDAADASPDYWRHVHSRIAAREEPRPYARKRHEVWLLRRRIEP